MKRKPRAARGVSRNGELGNGGAEHMQIPGHKYMFPHFVFFVTVRIVYVGFGR